MMRSASILGLFSSAGLVVTLGCGGGDLELVQTVPADMASEVPTDIVVTAEFDTVLNRATVTTSTFTLNRDGGADVEGRVARWRGQRGSELRGKTASFTPARSLGLLSAYTATLTTAIENVSGQTLAMMETWSFRTRDGQWGDSVLIETGDEASLVDLQVAVDPNGNAVAIWERYGIFAKRFTLAGGWGVAERIETDTTGNASSPQVAVDPNGNAVVVWAQSDGMRFSILAKRFTPAGGWGVAERIETDTAVVVFSPQVALDANGNAIAVWRQSVGTRLDIWASRFTPARSWGVAERIETDDTGVAREPQVAVDLNGNAVAVWAQSDWMRNNIWASRFTLAGGWGVAERIETDDAGDARQPQVAVDPNGNAVVVWAQSDGMRDNIWANRFTLAEGWGAAERIETDDAYGAFDPQVAVDPNGNALAVWHQLDGIRGSIFANRFTPAGGWGVAERIETYDAGNARLPQVALDPNGNAVAVWEQTDGMRDEIWANRFTLAGGWGVAERIETDDAGDASSPQVALDPNGNALAVWEQFDGIRNNIWANRFE